MKGVLRMDAHEKLMDQYDDAAFALLMDRSAEEEGAELLRAFREASAADALPEYTHELDQRCRDSIDREFGRQTRRVRFRRFARSAVRAAIVVFAMIGLAGTLIMSVEAWRVPVINYFIDSDSEFFMIDDNTSDSNTLEVISDCMPDGYLAVNQNMDGDNQSIAYQNKEGDFALFEILSKADSIQFDAEDAAHRKVSILGCDGILILKNGVRILWANGNGTAVYSIYATNIAEEELLEIAAKIASQLT